MAHSDNEQIISLLNQLVRVTALQVAADRSVTDGVRLLKIAGLDNQTIADVLNTSAAVVRTLASNLATRKRNRLTGRRKAR